MAFKNPDKIQKLHRMLTEAERPVIVTHTRPDGDAIGSTMGMYHTLKLYGKNPKVALANPIPGNIDFLMPQELAEDIFIHEENKEGTEEAVSNSDLIICLDFKYALKVVYRLNDFNKSTTNAIIIVIAYNSCFVVNAF